jgi:transposase
MNKHQSQSSRKASGIRADRLSNQAQSSKVLATVQPSVELIKLGVDTHAGQYTFARMEDHLGMQPTQSLSPAAFVEFLARQKQMSQRVVMVYEAGPYGFSLHRQAVELGVECLVCAPERLSRGRKRVNDKIDARELLSRLDRHLAGNSAALRLVHPPAIEQEMKRRLARERNTYRKERQRWMARGRSLLHTLGVARPGRWTSTSSVESWEFLHLEQLIEQLARRYGQAVREELDRYLLFIELASKQLEELTDRIKQAHQQKQASGQEIRIKGVGPLSSELLDREMGDWNRFANRRAVASYTGLCPGEDSSGDNHTTLSIDKHGNPRVRALLVELAWLLPRYQPDYKALVRWKWVFDPQSKAPVSLRKKAVVAMARRLAVDLWRVKTARVKPQDLGLKLSA